MVSKGAGALAVLAALITAGALWWMFGSEPPREPRLRGVSADDDHGELAPVLPVLPMPRPVTSAEPSRPSASFAIRQVGASSGTKTVLDSSTSSPSEAFVSGWLVGSSGLPLADHIVELEGQKLPNGGWFPEGRSTTNRAGRFYCPDISAGMKLLRISGPGEGDLLHAPPSWQKSQDPTVPGTFVAEGYAQLDVPARGVADMTLVSSGHPEFWVLGHLPDLPVDAAAPKGERRVRALSARMVDAAGNEPSPHPELQPLGAGPVLAIVAQHRYPSDVNDSLVLAPAWTRDARFLEVRMAWARDIRHPIVPPESGDLLDVGVLGVEAAGQIHMRAVFGKSHQDVWQPSLRCLLRGGGHPDAELVPEWDKDRNAWTVWTDRSSGTWEILATARDFDDGRASGELRPFLDLQLDVVLTLRGR